MSASMLLQSSTKLWVSSKPPSQNRDTVYLPSTCTVPSPFSYLLSALSFSRFLLILLVFLYLISALNPPQLFQNLLHPTSPPPTSFSTPEQSKPKRINRPQLRRLRGHHPRPVPGRLRPRRGPRARPRHGQPAGLLHALEGRARVRRRTQHGLRSGVRGAPRRDRARAGRQVHAHPLQGRGRGVAR